MKVFASGASFDASTARLAFTIAANDFQRDLLLPALLRRIAASTARIDLRVVPSGLPTAAMPGLLRHNMMREFACVAVPLKSGRSAALTELPMYAAWHQRFQGDPSHVWLRALLEETAAAAARR